jgi:hypothetical protein
MCKLIKRVQQDAAATTDIVTYVKGVPTLGALAGSFLPLNALTVKEEAALTVHREEAMFMKKARVIVKQQLRRDRMTRHRRQRRRPL